MGQPIIKPTVHKVGFISPPAWFDISPTEFLRIAPNNTIVMQTVMRLPDFNYKVDRVEQFINSVPELGACFNSLAEAGADVVTQFGYPFSLVITLLYFAVSVGVGIVGWARFSLIIAFDISIESEIISLEIATISPPETIASAENYMSNRSKLQVVG